MASCGIGSSVSPAHPPRPPVPFCSHSLLHFLSVRWISSVPFLLSPANFPSFLGFLSNRRASQAGGRRGSWALLLTQSSVLVACSLAQLVRTQEGAITSSVYFFPSSPLFPTSLLPSLLAFLCFSSPHPSSLFPLSPVFLPPSLGPDSYGFQVPRSYFRYNKTEARRGSQ